MKITAALTLVLAIILTGCNNPQYAAGKVAGSKAGHLHTLCNYSEYGDMPICHPKYNNPDFIRGFIDGEAEVLEVLMNP